MVLSHKRREAIEFISDYINMLLEIRVRRDGAPVSFLIRASQISAKLCKMAVFLFGVVIFMRYICLHVTNEKVTFYFI